MEFPFSFFRVAAGIAFLFMTSSTNNRTVIGNCLVCDIWREKIVLVWVLRVRLVLNPYSIASIS
jgi:hypothetical protein